MERSRIRRGDSHGESTTAVENDQHTSTNVDDVPEPPQHSPRPPEPPDRTAKQQDEPPSVELEGERRSRASCDDGPTSDVTDTSRASEGIEDDGNRPKKLRKALEHVSKRSDPKEREDSQGRPGDEPDEPGGETAVPGDCQKSQQRPMNVSNERVDEANTSHRDRGPGGDPGEREEPGDVEGDRERQSDGDGGEMDGRRCGKDGATSGTCRDSKRVETGPLAEAKARQHGRRKRETADVPRQSTPPTNHLRRPTDHPNPQRRRGRLKTRPRRVSTRARSRRSTHQAMLSHLSHQDRIGRIGGVVYELEVLVECHRATMDENEAADAEDDKIAHTGTHTATPAASPRLSYKAITRATVRLTALIVTPCHS